MQFQQGPPLHLTASTIAARDEPKRSSRLVANGGSVVDVSDLVLQAALERVIEQVATTQRNVSPIEAPNRLTNGYRDLMYAWTFARLGNHERSDECARQGIEAFATFDSDPIHAVLVAAFGARIRYAKEGRSRFAPLPEAIIDRRAALARVNGYKVGRLWSASRILDAAFEREDAPDRFNRRLPHFERPSHAVGADVVATLAVELGNQLEVSASLERDAGIALVAECLGRLIDLPAAAGMPLLTRAVALIDALPDPPVELRVAVLQVIARHGWGELIPSMCGSFANQLAELPTERLGEPLERSLQALRRLGLTSELVALLGPFARRIEVMPTVPSGRDTVPIAIRAMLAGSLAFAGDRSGLAVLDELRGLLEERKGWRIDVRLDLTRAVANGYAFTPIADVGSGLGRLMPWFADVTDSYGTNSHYCLSVLDFIDAIVVSIAKARIGRGPP